MADGDGAASPRKRKTRGGAAKADPAQKPSPRERMASGYARSAAKNEATREALEPLAEGERPTVVTVGAIVSALIALGGVLAFILGRKVNGERPEFIQMVAPTLLFAIMAWGMWTARYWAVLGFQVLLVFALFGAFFGITTNAHTVPQFLATGALLAGAGTFFFFMVKAMARIQMPYREPRE